MNLIVIGINHQTAPLNVREGFAFSADEIRDVSQQLTATYFSECLLVSTCNRTEVYGIPTRTADPADVIRALADFKGIDTIHPEHFYIYHGEDAVRHLFKVACGIDSMVIGDVQVLGQIKESFQLADEAKTSGWFLRRLMLSTYHAGKRARTETEVCKGTVSVSSAAVELAAEHFGDLSTRKALIIGAGDTSKLSAKHLRTHRIGELVIANRTREHAETLIGLVGGKVISMDEIPAALAGVDLVISSVHAASSVITRQMVESSSRTGNLLLIDLGVPRNIDETVNGLPGVTLHDIDRLSQIVSDHRRQRNADIPKVEAIVEEEMNEFRRWFRTLKVHPTIEELHSRFESVRKDELEKYLHRFSDEDKELVDMITQRIVRKLLHCPTVSLKDSCHADPTAVHEQLHTIRHLFGLTKTSS